jgi:hypothetical protein
MGNQREGARGPRRGVHALGGSRKRPKRSGRRSQLGGCPSCGTGISRGMLGIAKVMWSTKRGFPVELQALTTRIL